MLLLKSYLIILICMWLAVQHSASVPILKVCKNFGSFSGSLEIGECCINELKCPISVDDSTVNELINSRRRRAPLLQSVADDTLSFNNGKKSNFMELDLCETRSSSLQPIFGTRYSSVTGEQVQILQIPTTFVQNVVISKCAAKHTKVFNGNCVQEYKPEEIYAVTSRPAPTISGNATVIKREFVWVESGCKATFDLTPFQSVLSQVKREHLLLDPSPVVVEITSQNLNPTNNERELLSEDESEEELDSNIDQFSQDIEFPDGVLAMTDDSTTGDAPNRREENRKTHIQDDNQSQKKVIKLYPVSTQDEIEPIGHAQFNEEGSTKYGDSEDTSGYAFRIPSSASSTNDSDNDEEIDWQNSNGTSPLILNSSNHLAVARLVMLISAITIFEFRNGVSTVF